MNHKYQHTAYFCLTLLFAIFVAQGAVAQNYRDITIIHKKANGMTCENNKHKRQPMTLTRTLLGNQALRVVISRLLILPYKPSMLEKEALFVCI